MAGYLKKLFSKKDKGDSDDTIALLEPDLTIARANSEMQLRTQAATDLWGIDEASWEVNLDRGMVVFTNDEREMVITAPVQVVGTYDTEDDSWLWGWDHPSVSESMGEFARRVRIFGERYGREKLTTRKIAATMDNAWEFTALACYLNGGQGGYCGTSGSTRILMVYGTVSLNKKD